MRWLLSMVAIVIAMTHAPGAQGADPAAADALFRQGRAAMEARDYAKACPKFAQSQALDPAPGTLVNLADCEEHIGKTADALAHWRQAVETMSAQDERAAFARQRIDALERSVPKLLIKVVGSSANLRVWRDDAEITESIGATIPTNPGAHTVIVRWTGHAERRYPITLREAEVSQVIVDPPQSSAASTNSQVDASSSDHSAAGWIIGGVGVAGLIVGSTAGVLAIQRKATVRDNCTSDMVCNQEGKDAAQSGSTYATVSTVGFAVGVVGVGLGAYLLLNQPSKTSTSQTVLRAKMITGGWGMSLSHSF